MTPALDACQWPMSRAGEALEALARGAGMPVRAARQHAPPDRFHLDRIDTQSRWLEAAAASLGVEVEAAEITYADIERFLHGAAPALIRIAAGGTSSLLALRAGTPKSVSLVAPDLSIRRAPAASLRAAVREGLDAGVAAETDAVLEEAGIPPSRRPRVRAALVGERLASETAAVCWLVRLPASADVRAQGSHAHLWSRLAALVSAHALAFVLWIVSWWIVGRAALEGRLDQGWLAAWALLLATLIPLELAVTWLQGRIAIDGGALLKRRLLVGALRLEPEEIRHEGAGQLLGRVVEAQAIEALALSGGFLALVALVELLMAGVVLGAVGAWLPALLAASAVIAGALAWRFFTRRRAWTDRRLSMTHDLVERMVGHRTRLAQEARDGWHEHEDQEVERYLQSSRDMDRAAVWLLAVAPRGWLLIGVAGVSPLFITGATPTPMLAVALGGILLAYRAFRRLAAGLSHLAGAAIAWTQAAPVFRAAVRPQPIGSPAFALAAPSSDASGRGPLLDGHELSFRYRDRGEPVLRGCSLQIERGERILLQGPSGCGKSTLASVLTGLRTPESGLLLLDGVDRQTLGADGWRRRVVAVPQFHENHVFMGTFAFNLLMGGDWPPSASEFERAETICRDLGLGELLEKMPAGLLQQVGETGWQLSHGERSRLFIARALLQGADLIVLDESFAQLDPENLQRTLRCVLERAPTVLVIAHP